MNSRRIRFAAAITIASIVLLIPCFWHRHIEAGDLGSHAYNAWLTSLVENGQAPGLYIAPSWTNILFDDMLLWFGKALGFAAGERIAVCATVLIFFWGTFAFISAVSGRPPWPVAPAIAMLSYGFTFNSGFFNCYLSVGLVFFALAYIWRARNFLHWLAAACFMALGIAAHPFGLVVVLGMGIYRKAAQSLSPLSWARWLLFALAFLAVFVSRVVLSRFSPVYEAKAKFFLFNGGDQLYLFGLRYFFLGQLVILFSALIFLSAKREPTNGIEPDFRVPLELWAALIFAALLLPQVVTLPQYANIFGPIVSRLTLITAVLAFAVVACAYHKPVPVAAGYVLFAAFFFAFLYQDTGVLNKMADQADAIVTRLPPGTRVVETLGGKRGWRTTFMHIIEPECVGHCFVYDNYEPASKQFRIRARPDCRLSATNMQEAVLLQYGMYSVAPSELPLKEIYQCTVEDLVHLCIRDVAANQPNCAGCNYAFYGGTVQ